MRVTHKTTAQIKITKSILRTPGEFDLIKDLLPFCGAIEKNYNYNETHHIINFVYPHYMSDTETRLEALNNYEYQINSIFKLARTKPGLIFLAEYFNYSDPIFLLNNGEFRYYANDRYMHPKPDYVTVLKRIN